MSRMISTEVFEPSDAREETSPQLDDGIVAGGPPALLGTAGGPPALLEERARQLRLFPPPKPLTERFGAEFFRAIPAVPGVYRMFDGAGRIIYIGQSQNLRDRLNSYRQVHPERDSRKTVRLVHEVRRIEWEICDSPASARLRENELLRTVRPRFNRVNVWPWACFYLAWRECGPRVASPVPQARSNWRCCASRRRVTAGRVTAHSRAARSSRTPVCSGCCASPCTRPRASRRSR